MDYEAKRPLVKQIDQSLLKHAAALGSKEGGPELTDVYRLQGLAETHRYLRWEHEFQPGEVEALLQFDDPLVVARRCWEARDPEKGFPICDLLQEIKAYERFPLLSPQAREDAAVLQALNDLLDKNMSDFDASLGDMTEEEIAEIDEITSTREIYSFLRYDHEFGRPEAELLLRMENPLKFLVDNYPCYDLVALATKALDGVIEESGKEVSLDPRHDSKDAISAEKPSILKQLKESRQEARQQPAPAEHSKGDEVR